MMLDLAVLHYHLLPGGVTSVIRDGLHSLLERRPGLIDSIRLLTGRPEGVEAVVGALRACVRATGAETSVDATVDPLLGYEEVTAHAPLALATFAAPDAVWWVHNHHLGKNAAVTRAVLDIATGGANRLLLQIHDFPECGRLDLYARLRSRVTGRLYPIGPNVRYAVINQRDQAVLIDAGIPRGSVHLLWNPVLAPRTDLTPTAVAPPLAPLMPGPGPFWLYPVRARRRKNILEAGLLARLYPATVGVTLPATSIAERTYAERAISVFRVGTLPGRIGFGEQPRFRGWSLNQLAGGSDAVVSTSIEEGFGYQFVHALQWSLPLIARDIDAIDDLRDLFPAHQAVWYRELMCRLLPRECMEVRARYRARLARLAPWLPGRTAADALGELEERITAPLVDYSFLSFDAQLAVARRAAEPPETESLRSDNAALLDRVRAVAEHSRARWASPSDAIAERYGPQAFATRAQRALEWPDGSGSIGDGDGTVVLARFAAPAYQRLLFDPV